MRVLLIEDDRAAARSVELMLKDQGVRVEFAECGETGIELGEVYDYDLILLDAYRGGYVPFHLLTREFYALVKQRLAPGGAAAFNVHDGSKLYASTVKTLGEVFPALDLYPTGTGEVIAVAGAAPLGKDELERKAAALQASHGFRFPLTQILSRRIDAPRAHGVTGDVITDDFAPADVYDVMGREPRRRK